MKFMFDRVDFQKAFEHLMDDTIELSQKIIDVKLEEKIKEREAAERALMEAEEAAMKEHLKKLEEERKRREEEEKKKAEEQKKEEIKPAKPAAKVVVSKSVGRAPRASVRRLAPSKPVPKAQGKKGASNAKRPGGEEGSDAGINVKALNAKEAALVDGTPKRKTQAEEEVKSIEDVKDEEPEIKLADFNENDLKSIKNQISSELIKKLTEDSGKLSKQLSILFDIDVKNEDTSETTKAVMKRFKDRFKKLVDLDDEVEPVAEKLDRALIDLG